MRFKEIYLFFEIALVWRYWYVIITIVRFEVFYALNLIKALKWWAL